jgi:predicted O-methyltransferase YrrM
LKKARIETGTADSFWVSRLARSGIAEVRESILEISQNYDFNSSIEEKLWTGGRSNYVQIADPFELYSLIRLLKPRIILEVGVSAGVSSAYFLKALD